MNISYLLNFVTLDNKAFVSLMDHSEYQQAAVYRLNRQRMIYALGTPIKTGQNWPQCLELNSYYTKSFDQDLPIGNEHAARYLGSFYKKFYLYFPEQVMNNEKIVFIIKSKKWLTRPKIGALDVFLEIIAKRIHFSFDNTTIKYFIDKFSKQEPFKHLNVDLQILLNHELRNPLSSILGYTELMAQGQLSSSELIEYLNIIRQQVKICSDVVDRIDMAFNLNANKTNRA